MGIISLIQTMITLIINIFLSGLILFNVWLSLNNVEGILSTIKEILFWIIPAMTIISIWSPSQLSEIKIPVIQIKNEKK